MTLVFVDTSAWYALIDRAEPYHAAVTAALKAERARLLTSNFVLDETVTLLRYRLGWAAARSFGEELLAGRLAKLVPVTPADERAAWGIFLRYRDRALSFTDCTSFAVMQRLRLDTAIAVDGDFRSFGLDCRP